MRTRQVTVAALLGSCAVIIGTSSAFASSGPTLFEQQLGFIGQQAQRPSLDALANELREIRDSLQKNGPGIGTPFQFTSDPNKIDPDLLADTNFDPNLLAYPDLLGYAAKAGSKRAAAPVYKAAPRPVGQTFKYAVWGQGFYDSETRSGTFNGADIGRSTHTSGGVGGADVVILNYSGKNDALVLGILGSGSSSNTNNNDGSTSRVNGPGFGVYAAYVDGPFSADVSFKVDDFSLTSTTPGAAEVSVRMTNYNVAGNASYKIPYGTWWIEPTIGASHTSLAWNNVATALGFQDGTTVRVQGGARVGPVTAWNWNGIRVEPTLAGMLYSDVAINGGSVPPPAGTPAAPNDEGKVFGQGIGKLNFILNSQLSASVEGEVRGRDGVSGAAVRGGMRWSLN